MSDFSVRITKTEDVPRILEIYEIAREFMRKTGNPDQWGTTNPEPASVYGDAKHGTGRVIEKDGRIVGAFAFIPGKDPTYDYIEDGAWVDDVKPYSTIHRVASDGTHGIFDAMLAYAKTQSDNLRIDTYKDNLIMQHLIESRGFTKCGIIYVRDHSPRIAYQMLAEK